MKNIKYVLLNAMFVAVFLLLTPMPAAANGYIPPVGDPPAAGSWTWTDENVEGTIVPQSSLMDSYVVDYAILQSNGIYINGPTTLCHPYPGGGNGWNAEIRVWTSQGWQSVPTTNQWVPDEEGKFMSCAQVWFRGTYAVFGYWVKPEGWNVHPVYD